MKVCVYGASSNEISEEYLNAGFRLGELMAQNGMELVFGGGDTGMMGAVNRGIRKCGGKSIGVAPRFFDVPGILSIECTEFIFTDTMRQRKQKMEDLADAFIMTAGGIGTFEEFFEILTLKQLRQNDRPLLILNTDGYFDELIQLLKSTVEKGFMTGNVLKLFDVVNTPDDAVTLLRSNG